MLFECKIVRYEQGIYYIPKQTRFSSSAGPTPETVARYKYISRGGKTDGYYSGSTFASIIGPSPFLNSNHLLQNAAISFSISL